MSNKRRLTHYMRLMMDGKQNRQGTIPGELGATMNGAQHVKVPGRNSYVYVRLRGNTSEIIQAFNEQVNAIYGLPVLVVRRNRRYYVLGRDIDRYDGWGGDDGNAQLAPHGAQHSFGSSYGSGWDVVWVFKRQFMPLLLRPESGLTAHVEEDWYLWEENYNHFTGSNINLAPAKPFNPGDARFVSVYLDGDTNTIKGLTGTLFDSEPFPSDLDNYIPTIPYSVGIPVGAVLLTQQTTYIAWSDLYDIRPLFVGRPGSIVGSLRFYEDGAFKVTGSSVDFTNNLDVSVSGSRATVKANLSVKKSNTLIGTRRAINFNEGAGIGLTIADDAGNDDVDVTVFYTGTGGSGGAYPLVGVPTSLVGGVTGTYWRVPVYPYLTGTLAIFINGVSQIPNIDYQAQYPQSGTYQLLDTPPTGSTHLAMWAVSI